MANSAEGYWRTRAESLLLSDLRTELYQELREMLELREHGPSGEVDKWLDAVESTFLKEYEHSEDDEESSHELVALAELFSSEGVEAWLEALELFRQGAESEDVLEAAESGQRYLRVVEIMAQEFSG